MSTATIGGDVSGMIFDYLVSHPDGGTVHDFAEALSFPLPTIRRGIRDARMILGEGDTLFILCEPQGAREPWRYYLVDGSQVVNMEESNWAVNRIHDAQSRVALIATAMRVAERATDGRTLEGKKARVLARACSRLVEDLEEIDLGG